MVLSQRSPPRIIRSRSASTPVGSSSPLPSLTGGTRLCSLAALYRWRTSRLDLSAAGADVALSERHTGSSLLAATCLEQLRSAPPFTEAW